MSRWKDRTFGSAIKPLQVELGLRILESHPMKTTAELKKRQCHLQPVHPSWVADARCRNETLLPRTKVILGWCRSGEGMQKKEKQLCQEQSHQLRLLALKGCAPSTGQTEVRLSPEIIPSPLPAFVWLVC